MADNTVTMIDPQGTARQIPQDRADAATQAGAKPATKITDPQGTPRWIPNDQVDAALQAGGKRFDESQPSFYERAQQATGQPAGMDPAIGFLKGVEQTSAGIGSLIRKGVDVVSAVSPSRIGEMVGAIPKGSTEATGEKIKETLVPKQGLTAMEEQAKPEGIAQWVGYGGETLTELLLPDKAIRGLSLAEKLLTVSKVAESLEKFPKLMKAVQMGIDVGKAGTELGPEELSAIQKSPILARLVGEGMNSLRLGTVQAAQTAVRTGGDVKKAAEEGATMAGTSAVLGGVGAVVGGALERAGKLGKTLKTATKGVSEAEAVAKGVEARPAAAEAVGGAVAAKPPLIEAPAKGVVPEHKEIASVASQAVNKIESTMHTTYDEGVQQISADLEGQKISLDGSPLAQAAKEAQAALKQEPKGLTKRLGESLQGMIPGTERGEKMVGTLLGESAKAEDVPPSWLMGEEIKGSTASEAPKPESLSVNNLINYRQRLTKMLPQLQYDDPNKQVLYKLVTGVDDTIQKMADESGTPETSTAYKALRDQYKDQVQFFNSSSAKNAGNPMRYQVAQKLQSESLNNVPQYLLGGNNSLAKVKVAKELLGEESVDNLASQTIRRWAADAINPENGRLNAKKLIDQWNKVPADTRAEFFSKAGDGYHQMIADLSKSPEANKQTLDSLNRLIRFGVFPAIGFVTGRELGKVSGDTRAEWYGALAGALYGGGRREIANDLIKYLAEHPGYLSGAGKAAEAARPATKVAGTIVKQQTAQGLMGKPSLANVYSGTAPALGEQ